MCCEMEGDRVKGARHLEEIDEIMMSVLEDDRMRREELGSGIVKLSGALGAANLGHWFAVISFAFHSYSHFSFEASACIPRLPQQNPFRNSPSILPTWAPSSRKPSCPSSLSISSNRALGILEASSICSVQGKSRSLEMPKTSTGWLT